MTTKNTAFAQRLLLPRWNIFEKKLDPGSRDPLGFQRYATLFADQLLPNLTVLTIRARYYSFISWALREIASYCEPRLIANDPVTFEEYDNLLMRFERFLAFAEAIRHEDSGGVCSWIGQRRSSSLIRKGRSSIPLDVPLTVQEGSNGALADYRQSMQKLGLLSPKSMPLPDTLTEEGEKLARLYRDAISKSKADRIRDLCLDVNLSSVAYDKLRTDGRFMCLSEISEAERKDLRPRLLRNEHAPVVMELKHFLTSKRVSEFTILLNYLNTKSRDGVAFTLRQAAVYQILALACLGIFVGVRNSFEIVDQEYKVNDLISHQLKLEGIQPTATIISLTKRVDWEKEISALNIQDKGEPGTWILPSVRLLSRLAKEIQSESRLVLEEPIISVSLRDLTELMLQEDCSIQELLTILIERLVNTHQQVFLSKSKQPWMYLEGTYLFLSDQAQEPAPQFPPNRIRLQSLISLKRDLEGRHD